MVNVFHYLINLERFGVYLYVELIGNLAHSELHGNQRTKNVPIIALTILLGVNLKKKSHYHFKYAGLSTNNQPDVP